MYLHTIFIIYLCVDVLPTDVGTNYVLGLFGTSRICVGQ